MSTAQIIIGLVVVVVIVAIAVWAMTRQSPSPSPTLGASTGAGGGGLWSSIFGIGGSALSTAGGIIDQQQASQAHSDPVFQSSSTTTVV